MWLYIIVAALVLLGAVGGIAFGGIFTIILIPLAVVVLVGGLLTAASGRSAQRQAGGEVDAAGTPDTALPQHFDRPSGRAPTSPEGLADARRAQQ